MFMQFTQFEANIVYASSAESFCPACEGNSTPSPRLAGRLQLFFKHKPWSTPHTPTGMQGPLTAFHAALCLHSGAVV